MNLSAHCTVSSFSHMLFILCFAPVSVPLVNLAFMLSWFLMPMYIIAQCLS